MILSLSPTTAPSASFVGRGGGDVDRSPVMETPAPAAAGQTASPTGATQPPTTVEGTRGFAETSSPTAVSADRGFVGNTLAPALPWLVRSFGVPLLFA